MIRFKGDLSSTSSRGRVDSVIMGVHKLITDVIAFL